MLKRLYNKMFKNSATVAEPSETGMQKVSSLSLRETNVANADFVS